MSNKQPNALISMMRKTHVPDSPVAETFVSMDHQQCLPYICPREVDEEETFVLISCTHFL